MSLTEHNGYVIFVSNFFFPAYNPKMKLRPEILIAKSLDLKSICKWLLLTFLYCTGLCRSLKHWRNLQPGFVFGSGQIRY